MRTSFLVLVILALSLRVALVAGGSESARSSPFVPAGKKPAPAAPTMDPALQALQLSGISVIGDEKRFNFFNANSKQSFWLALGVEENGLRVESYDKDADAVVVRKGGFTRRLELRQSKIVAEAPPSSSSGPTPLKSAPGVPDIQLPGVDEIKDPKTPVEIKQAEFEARMLVSDLLEISMQERARQRAKREAAARAGQP